MGVALVTDRLDGTYLRFRLLSYRRFFNRQSFNRQKLIKSFSIRTIATKYYGRLIDSLLRFYLRGISPLHRPLKTSILRAGEIHIFGFNWKPTSAVVLHRPPPPTEIGDPGSLKRSHIISDALPRQMNQAQQALMQEINIPFLYLYDTYFLSEPWIFKRDYRHYQDGISALLLIFYWPGQNQTHTGMFMQRNAELHVPSSGVTHERFCTCRGK